MKFLLRLRAKKGVTLVECVIATAIFALLMTAVFSMYQPIANVVELVSSDSGVQRIVSAGEQFISQRLRNVAELEVIWDEHANKAAIFADDIKDHGGTPRALIVFNGRLYDMPLLDSTGASIALPTTTSALNTYRVFNESFYGPANLVVTVAIECGGGSASWNPAHQMRGKTFLNIRVDAEVSDKITMSSRTESDVMLTWIGRNGGTDCSSVNCTEPGICGTPSRTFRARANPEVSDGDTKITTSDSVGDILSSAEVTNMLVIVYHADPQLGRMMNCQGCGMPTPCTTCCSAHGKLINLYTGRCEECCKETPPCPALAECKMCPGSCGESVHKCKDASPDCPDYPGCGCD
ncbi:MAG: prepilin-type N-terminal cleavage/methylation domain-containing protein [Oscillospiraceae bacterium]|nr:prepilin-type N-terminal cleavage/methylation domain-containing protein [Oscillospiraceae bacterium]